MTAEQQDNPVTPEESRDEDLARATGLLDQLAKLEAAKKKESEDYEAWRNSVIPAEVRAQLVDGGNLLASKLGALEDLANDVKKTLVPLVTKLGCTVKGKDLMAVYTPPPTVWDTKALDGYAAAHPEIKVFRSEGKPKISVRSA